MARTDIVASFLVYKHPEEVDRRQAALGALSKERREMQARLSPKHGRSFDRAEKDEARQRIKAIELEDAALRKDWPVAWYDHTGAVMQFFKVLEGMGSGKFEEPTAIAFEKASNLFSEGRAVEALADYGERLVKAEGLAHAARLMRDALLEAVPNVTTLTHIKMLAEAFDIAIENARKRLWSDWRGTWYSDQLRQVAVDIRFKSAMEALGGADGGGFGGEIKNIKYDLDFCAKLAESQEAKSVESNQQ